MTGWYFQLTAWFWGWLVAVIAMLTAVFVSVFLIPRWRGRSKR